MAGSDETPEYDPEPFVRRKTFYIKAECELAGTSNPLHGKMFVESLLPLMKQQQYPIVLIHGDYHTGQIWLTKPDGKPGWAAAFLHAGYQVYVIDLPPIGRSNVMTDKQFADKREKLNFMPPGLAEKQLTAPQKTDVENELENLGWPTAIFHDKWPGTGKRGDTTFENYHMSTAVLSLQKEERQLLAQTALRNLLKESGKAILLGQGSGTTMAWLAADAEPDLVAGVIAVEPAGPPFGLAHTMVDKRRQYTESVKLDMTNRLYGLADIPLTYEPPTRPVKMEDNKLKVVPFDLDLYKEPITGATCILQRDANKTRETQPLTNLGKSSSPCRPRQLIHLKKMPHVVITAQAGSHSMFDWATVMFMLQAGLSLEWMRLEQHSIFGNGHLMFLETNSNEIAALLFDWINRAVKECQSPTSTFTLTDEELHFDGSSFQPIDLTIETDPHMGEAKTWPDNVLPQVNSLQSPTNTTRRATNQLSIPTSNDTPQKQPALGPVSNSGRHGLAVHDTPTPQQAMVHGYQATKLVTHNGNSSGKTKFPYSPWRRDRARFRGHLSNLNRRRSSNDQERTHVQPAPMPIVPFNPYPSPPYNHGQYNGLGSIPLATSPATHPAWVAYYTAQSCAMPGHQQDMPPQGGFYDVNSSTTGTFSNRNSVQVNHRAYTQRA